MTTSKPETQKEKLLRMLKRLTEKVERANNIQHSRTSHTIPAEDWSELHQLTAESKALILEVEAWDKI